MTTRSGRSYQQLQSAMTETEIRGAEMSVAEMMRLMMDERKRHDSEITAERERKEVELAAERRRHDEELAEERQARAREADERTNVMMRQMETLERLAAGTGVREPAVWGGALGVGKPRLTKLGERDDIEAYLRTFERMMAVFEVERGQWSYMLAPQLTGKAQKAFAALEDGAAGDYDALKAAILKRYGINEEAYRQRLMGGWGAGRECCEFGWGCCNDVQWGADIQSVAVARPAAESLD